MPSHPPCLVFLDLSWPGTVHQRVLIHLNPNTPMGRQFLLLCTGQLGPSYARSTCEGVWAKGKPGERLYFGNYKSSDGKDGAALLPNLAKGYYKKSGHAGTLFGTWQWNGNTRGAYFGILTRNRQDGKWSDVFGEVAEGMDCLAAAIKHCDVTEVTIVDCGVVLKQ